jgi:hypothetical protein
LKKTRWLHDGIAFERERHSFAGPVHGFAVDVVVARRDGRRGWSLMVVKEHWWSDQQPSPLRSVRWAKVLGGQRGDVLGWLQQQEAALDRTAVGSEAEAGEPTERDHG